MNIKKRIIYNTLYFFIILLLSLSVTSSIFTNVYDKPVGNNIVNNFNKIFKEHEKNFVNLEKLKKENEICEQVITENLTRHSLRWIGESLKIKLIQKVNSTSPSHKTGFFLYLLIVSIMISTIFLLISSHINQQNNQKLLSVNNFYYLSFYYLFLLFFLTKPLGELRFSIFEFFLIGLSLYFSLKKKFLLYLISVIICIINRESGIIVSFFWFLINIEYSKNILLSLKKKKFLILSLIPPSLGLLTLITLNWDVLSCVNNFNFLISGEMDTRVSEIKVLFKFSTLNHIFTNYFLIFFILLLFYKNSKISFLLIILIYLIIFYFFTPINQYEIRILILPMLMFYIFLK